MMNIPVRLFADHWVCVFNKKNPRVLVANLLKCKGYENEKYKLFIPQNMMEAVIEEQPNEKHRLQNLFDLATKSEMPRNYEHKGEKSNFPVAPNHQGTTNISRLFDNSNNFKSSQEMPPINSINNMPINPVKLEEGNKGTERNTKISTLFDSAENRSEGSIEGNKSGVGGHNLLRKEHIIINPSYSNLSESSRSNTQVMNKLDQWRMPEKVSDKSNPGLPGQQFYSKEQPPETRIESAYDHGEDVWLDDDFEVESKMNSKYFQQQKTSPWATHTETQQRTENNSRVTEFSGNRNYYKSEGRVQETISQSNSIYCKQNFRHDHSPSVNLSRNSESQNKYDQTSMWSRRDERDPANRQSFEEPPNKVAKLFDMDTQTRQQKNYHGANQHSFNQQSRLHENTDVVIERHKFHASDDRNFDRMGYDLANPSQSFRSSTASYSQRPENHMKRVFDMTDQYTVPLSRSEFGREREGTGYGPGLRKTSLHPSTDNYRQESEQEREKLWKNNIKQMFDQRGHH